MRVKRIAIGGLCLIGVLAMTAASAQAAPRWWVRETGSVARSELTPSTPETLLLQGAVTLHVVSGKAVKCLVKGRGSMENPAILTSAGVGGMESFEGICEKGAPPPCLPSEPSEFTGIFAPNWPSELVEIGTKIYDRFTGSEIKVFCLKTKFSGIYKAVAGDQLTPLLGTGTLKFEGPPYGELEAGPAHIYLTGKIYVAPESSLYKLVRAP